jgi:putative zinc finger/helix-turn-helix YgiT family protein
MNQSSDRLTKSRPFPWICPECRKREVYPAQVEYIAAVQHDAVLHRVPIPQLTIPQCRACGELLFSGAVDEQINTALRAQLQLLTPEQIKAGREALSLAQTELAERLGVEQATLDRWETGLLIQSRAMDNLLRVYFAVPEVRAALTGKGQDPQLGATLAISIGQTHSAATAN